MSSVYNRLVKLLFHCNFNGKNHRGENTVTEIKGAWSDKKKIIPHFIPLKIWYQKKAHIFLITEVKFRPRYVINVPVCYEHKRDRFPQKVDTKFLRWVWKPLGAIAFKMESECEDYVK